ncbi:MAG: hypothetical protein R3F50_04650 [Gammaproteobacteria bacterium]
MELIFLKKIIDILVDFLKNLFKQKSLRKDCKAAGDKVSEAIKELLSLRPNLNKVKALLSDAEKLCPTQSEDLFRAKEMLESIQIASRSIEKSVPSLGTKTSKGKQSRKTTSKKKKARKKVRAPRYTAKKKAKAKIAPAKKKHYVPKK